MCSADRTRIVLAGLDLALKQLDHDGLGEVAGRAPLAQGWGDVEVLHVILQGD